MGKPTLIPLSVPWMIADEDSHLMLIAREKDRSAEVSFNGFRLPKTYSDPFQWGALQRITATCHGVRFAALKSAEDNFYTIEIPKYDWSIVYPPALLNLLGPYHELADIQGWKEGKAKWQRKWVDTGIVGNPNAYTFSISPTLNVVESSSDEEYKHYLFVGEDNFIELIGREMNWHYEDHVE